MKRFKYWLQDFRTGLTNLWKWFPIIWKDRDFDFSYIYEILQFKLEKQANLLEKNGRHSRVTQDVRDMRICVNLISKLKNNYYGWEYLDYHKSDIEFVPYEDPKYFEIKTTVIEDNLEMFFRKYPKAYQKVKDRSSNKIVIAMNISEINRKKAHNLLFKILKDKIEYWWD